MKKDCLKGCFCSKAGFTLIERVGQALPDNAPDKGHLAAFTLIELLVVVLIIGILAAVAVPQYQKAVEKSRLTEALTTVASLQKAMDVYLLENGYRDEELFGTQSSGNTLDVDVVSTLDCSSDYFCCSTHYCYEIYCYGGEDNECYIYAQSNPPNAPGITLEMYKSGNTPWRKMCSADSERLLFLCPSLEPLGWQTY